MNWVNDRLPTTALVLLLPLALVEPPVLVVAAAGRGGVFSFAPGFALATLGAVAAALLVRRHPGLTAVEISRALLGRGAGTAVAAGYALFWFLEAAWLLRHEASKVIDLLLPRTPVWAPVLYLLAVAAYLVARGVEPLGRWAFVVVPFALTVVLAFYVAGITQAEPARLADLPPGGPGEVAREAWRVAGALEGVALPLVLAGYLVRPGRLVAATLGGMALAFLGLGGAVVMVFSLWGVRAAQLYHWPAVVAVQNVPRPGLAFEKLELIYLGVVVMLGFGRFALLYLAAVLTIRGLLPASPPLGRVVLGLAPALLVASLLPPHFDALERMRAWLYPPAWVFVYALPALGLGLSHLRGPAGAGPAGQGAGTAWGDGRR